MLSEPQPSEADSPPAPGSFSRSAAESASTTTPTTKLHRGPAWMGRDDVKYPGIGEGIDSPPKRAQAGSAAGSASVMALALLPLRLMHTALRGLIRLLGLRLPSWLVLLAGLLALGSNQPFHEPHQSVASADGFERTDPAELEILYPAACVTDLQPPAQYTVLVYIREKLINTLPQHPLVDAAVSIAAELTSLLLQGAMVLTSALSRATNHAGLHVETLVVHAATLLNTVCMSVIPVIVLYFVADFASQQRKRKFEAAAQAIDLLSGARGEWLQNLLGTIPNWIMFPDVEKALWLNQALKEKLWDHLGPTLCEAIRASIEPMLETNKPIGVSSIKISEFTPGKVAPVITGIKYLSTQAAGECLLELGLTWSGNPTLTFHVSTALAAYQAIDVKVNQFQIFCPLRIGLKALMPKAPVIGGMTFCFIGKPTMDFSLSVAGGKLDMMAIPGLSSFLHHFLRNTITSVIVYPRQVEVPLHYIPVLKNATTGEQHPIAHAELATRFGVDFVPSPLCHQERTADPVGILSMVLIEAEDLAAGHDLLDITPSPFVILKMKSNSEETVRTKVISSTTHPKWNQHFDLLAYTDTDELELTVMDGNLWNYMHNGLPSLTSFANPLNMISMSGIQMNDTANDASRPQLSLGTAAYSTARLPPHTSTRVAIDLAGVKKGRLLCKLMWKPFHIPMPKKMHMHRVDSQYSQSTVTNHDMSGLSSTRPSGGNLSDNRSKSLGNLNAMEDIDPFSEKPPPIDADLAETEAAEGFHEAFHSPQSDAANLAGMRSPATQPYLDSEIELDQSCNGLLKLKVVRGIGIVERQGSLMRGFMGSSKVYLRITLVETPTNGDPEATASTTSKETSRLPGSKDPRWNEDFMFFICQPDACRLNVEVVDDTGSELGRLRLRLLEIFSNAGNTSTHVHNTWYLENIQQGQLEMVCEWKGPIEYLKANVKKRGDLHHSR